ncbi:MAG: TfoX/Sxy family protein [Gammaproteobacteria bacterium]
MSVGAAFLQYVLEQLGRAGRVTSRRMFGAVGLYCDGVFFAVIDDDTLFFKTGDDTRANYESRGMKPFRPYADKPEVSMSYYTVPADVLDDQEELVAWARQAVKIAAAAPKKTRRKTADTPKAPKKQGKPGRPGRPMKVTPKRSGPRGKSS